MQQNKICKKKRKSRRKKQDEVIEKLSDVSKISKRQECDDEENVSIKKVFAIIKVTSDSL